MPPIPKRRKRLRTATRCKEMHGAPISDLQFAAIPKATPAVVGESASEWRFMLRLVYWGGLRTSEAFCMHWTDTKWHRPVDLDTADSTLVARPKDSLRPSRQATAQAGDEIEAAQRAFGAQVRGVSEASRQLNGTATTCRPLVAATAIQIPDPLRAVCRRPAVSRLAVTDRREACRG